MSVDSIETVYVLTLVRGLPLLLAERPNNQGEQTLYLVKKHLILRRRFVRHALALFRARLGTRVGTPEARSSTPPAVRLP